MRIALNLRTSLKSCVTCVFAALILPQWIVAQREQPPLPIGLDAYRQWDRWPEQRIGMRAYMRSTYDRSGGNEGADSSHFLYQLADDANVTLDVEGQASLSSAATTTGTAVRGIMLWTERIIGLRKPARLIPCIPVLRRSFCRWRDFRPY